MGYPGKNVEVPPNDSSDKFGVQSSETRDPILLSPYLRGERRG